MKTQRKFRILSIDGGGIRGIIPGQFLAEVEKELHIKIADHFDMIVGTSTGGILATVLLCPNEEGKAKFTAAEVVNLYLDRGDDIFNVPTWKKIRSKGGITDEKYPSKGLEEALDDYLGDVDLNSLLKPALITSYDIRRRKAHFFKSHLAHRPDRNFYLKDVCRATSAAPTYFEVSYIKSMARVSYPLIDGGVFVNNPALCAYAEARSNTTEIFNMLGSAPKTASIKASDMAILSLGTGEAKKFFTHAEAKDWGTLKWAVNVIDIMMSGVSETVDFQLKQIYDSIAQPDQYLRIQPTLSANIDPDMDCATPENMNALKQRGSELFAENKEKIEAFINQY